MPVPIVVSMGEIVAHAKIRIKSISAYKKTIHGQHRPASPLPSSSTHIHANSLPTGVFSHFCRLNSPSKVEKMTDRKAVIKNADMSEDMQQDAVDCATQAIEKYNIEKVRLYLRRKHKASSILSC